LGLCQNKKLLHSGGNNQQSTNLDKELVSKIYKELINLTPQKWIIQFKNGQKTRIDIFPKKRHTDGQQIHEKMLLNITHHQGNTNPNYKEISPHTCQNGKNQQHKKKQVLARMWRKGNPLARLVRMQPGAATLENSMEVPQRVKNRTTLRSSNCTTRYLPKEYKNTNSKG